ncbi:hypothetical protein PGTUg99_020805 [Puccinia graminis f. sp. tritici]|uniref:Uncharacterized protein n=1 Tax=Puccinia graminis f. sp. tritici TaxID=56615 RepID=A0A5B0RCW1_PUCGR|nr:hypothetical protein PGTUg99_020805 [Puccinia graminis f. sp. tritici]
MFPPIRLQISAPLTERLLGFLHGRTTALAEKTKSPHKSDQPKEAKIMAFLRRLSAPLPSPSVPHYIHLAFKAHKKIDPRVQTDTNAIRTRAGKPTSLAGKRLNHSAIVS